MLKFIIFSYLFSLILNLVYIYNLFKNYKLYELHLSGKIEYFNSIEKSIEKRILNEIKIIITFTFFSIVFIPISFFYFIYKCLNSQKKYKIILIVIGFINIVMIGYGIYIMYLLNNISTITNINNNIKNHLIALSILSILHLFLFIILIYIYYI